MSLLLLFAGASSSGVVPPATVIGDIALTGRYMAATALTARHTAAVTLTGRHTPTVTLTGQQE
jgi:hypothetical protein